MIRDPKIDCKENYDFFVMERKGRSCGHGTNNVQIKDNSPNIRLQSMYFLN